MFTCDKCNKKYSYKSSLRRHLQTQHNNKKYPCPICKTLFSQPAQRSLHISIKHKKLGRFKCLYCESDVRFTNHSLLRKHVLKQHTKVPIVQDKQKMVEAENINFQNIQILHNHISQHQTYFTKPKLLCQFCYREFKNRFTLTRHINENHSTNLKIFDCSECSLNFKNKSSLVRHYKSQHLNEKKWKCPFCSKSFSRKYVLDRHKENHKKKDIQFQTVQEAEINKTVENNSEDGVVAVFEFDQSKIVDLSEKSNICKKCGACFSTEKGVRQHMALKHTQENSFEQEASTIKDPLILNRFKGKLTFDEQTLDALKHGYSELENAGKLADCTESEKILYETLKKPKLSAKSPARENPTQSTANSDILQNPTPTSPITSQKVHSCEICNQSFSRISDLKRHKLRHTGEKLFACEHPDCGKTFNNKSQRNQHFRMVHEKSKTKVECHVCGKKYASNSSLKVHMRNHVPNSEVYKCDECGSCFKTSHAKKVHKCNKKA